MKIKKIDNIMFRVKNLNKSLEFYQKVLGLKKVWEDKKNNMVGFQCAGNDSEIVIHKNKDIPNPDFSFLVDDVEEFVKDCKKKGYKIEKEPFEVRCGKLAVLRDLDNNKIPIIDLSKFRGKPRYD